MKRFFDSELKTFQSHLIKMGEIAIQQVRDSIQALVESDTEIARKVIAGDDELDQLEIMIDEEAIRYMNMRAPIAGDLRLVIMGMKASHDLERVGDEAMGIAKRAKHLSLETPFNPYIDVPRMAEMAVEMLRDALNCFLNGDTEKAMGIIQRDQEVDALNRQLYRELTRSMIEDSATISRAIEIMFISKSLERIADHATNIAEEMIYLAKGKDVRHDRALKEENASIDSLKL